MVCINSKHRNQQGSGIIDNLLRPFTVRKYGNEMHARSLDPNHFLHGYAYVGPKSELKLREQLHDDVPLNDLDATAKEHDYAYLKEKEEYLQDHDKSKHMKNIWHSDDVFVQKSKNSRDDPIVGNIASKLIATKEGLEKAGVMNTKTFSGFGKQEEESTDPVQRLRDLVKEQYKNESKQENKKKVQKGGIFPLVPIGIAVGSAIASKLAGDLYDWIKSKVTSSGSGYKMNHKTKKQKIEFIKDFINTIE